MLNERNAPMHEMVLTEYMLTTIMRYRTTRLSHLLERVEKKPTRAPVSLYLLGSYWISSETIKSRIGRDDKQIIGS